MTNEQFGAGPSLSDSSYPWDFSIDESGDIKTVSGLAELEKDIAFRIATQENNMLGRKITPTQMNRIRSTINDMIIQDSRVQSVLSLDVQRSSGMDNSIDVSATVQTVSGDEQEQQLVFSISD